MTTVNSPSPSPNTSPSEPPSSISFNITLALAPLPFAHSSIAFNIGQSDTISHTQNHLNGLNGLARDALDTVSDTEMVDGSFDSGQPENEKEDVTILDLDQVEAETEIRQIPRADDCKIPYTLILCNGVY